MAGCAIVRCNIWLIKSQTEVTGLAGNLPVPAKESEISPPVVTEIQLPPHRNERIGRVTVRALHCKR
jgi:hypothetical protein